MTEARRRVALVQRVLIHYRVEVFNQLASELEARGISFDIHAGDPKAVEALRDSRSSVPCCRPTMNRYLPGGLWWQPVLGRLGGADLVILEQANGALANYPVLLRRVIGGPRLAFFGHGAHLQATSGSMREAVKRALVGAVDHWFAYTTLSRDIVAAAGFPRHRITVVENSQRTHPLELGPEERREVRDGLGVGGRPMAVFCGRLVAQKNLPFILEGCTAARTQGLDLQLALIGDGPLEPWLAERAAQQSWIHLVGARFGTEKARILAAADVFVMPSGIGLSILDAFAAGLPVAAAGFGNHNPEIVYLTDGRNGVMTPPAAAAYGGGLVRILSDEARRRQMSDAARATAARYTVANMVGKFVAGIECALSPDASCRKSSRST